MNSLHLLEGFLVMHLTGLALMAGTTVADYATFRSFSKMFYSQRERSIGLLQLMQKLGVLLGLGAGLLIVSGAGMLIITHGAFAGQIWFKIKMLLILLLILNGFLVGGRQESKLKTIANENDPHLPDQIKKAILTLRVFFITQMGLFFTIVILAVFKFN